jgi:hypothetical protein
MSFKYDPSKIEWLAGRMYSSAASTEFFTLIIGLAFVAGGYFMPSSISKTLGQDVSLTIPVIPIEALPMTPNAVTLGIGVLLGALIILGGHYAAQTQRAQAQIMLCQVQIERNTASSGVKEPVA